MVLSFELPVLLNSILPDVEVSSLHEIRRLPAGDALTPDIAQDVRSIVMGMVQTALAMTVVPSDILQYRLSPPPPTTETLPVASQVPVEP